MPPRALPPLPCPTLLVCLCLGTSPLAGQQLVPNGSFEDCIPTCGLSGQESFNASVAAWTTPTIGSPDLFHTGLPLSCPNAANGSMDPQSWGGQPPYDGDAMIALITHCAICPQETREYAQAPLAQPLVPGTTYHARLFVSRGDRCRYATDGLGMHFSTTPPSATGWASLPQVPQVEATQVMTDALGWTLLAGDFTATEAHQWITIGNFLGDANTTIATVPGGALDYAVYFVDAVSLTVAGTSPYITGAAVLCAGDSLLLTAHNGTATTWYNVALPGIPLGSGNTLWVSPMITTTYALVQGTDSAFHTVQVLPAPLVDLGPDTALCAGDTLLLDATTPGATYLWQDGSTAPTQQASTPGTYRVTATIGSCTATDSITVQTLPLPPVDLGNDTTLCPGAMLLLDATVPGGSYLWENGSTAAQRTVTAPGTCTVQVSDGQCTATDSIRVDYETLPVYPAPADTVICAGDELRMALYPPGIAWLWQDGASTSPRYLTEAGTYAITVWTTLCVHTPQFALDTVACGPLLSMPNVFSPNGDGVNDRFVPIHHRGITRSDLVIHNRWGNRVYSTNDARIGWDGYDMPEGTYFWTVAYTDVRGMQGAVSGTVLVVR